MQPNYPYYDNNSLKDLNQSGQGQNKQGKKSNYKYYKGIRPNIFYKINSKINNFISLANNSFHY